MNSSDITIERAYKVRLRLTRRQTHTLTRLFGATRHVAFTNFFGKRAKHPRFKCRGQHAGVRFTLDQRRTQVDRTAGRVSLPGLGPVRFEQTYGAMPGRLRSVTLSRDAGGRYFASFTADQVPACTPITPLYPSVGIDLGLSTWVTLSTGTTIAAPKPLTQKLQRVRRYQRSMSRKRAVVLQSLGLDPNKPIPKGTRLPASKRMQRLKRRIGRLHVRIRDTRQNALHQFTARVVRENALIGIEDLAVKGMARGMGRRAFRRRIGDAALGQLRRQLEYKGVWHGRAVMTVDRFYPSSKLCSDCGNVNHGLKLNQRTWICPACGTDHDRDLNAAKNLEAEGLRLSAEATPRSGESGVFYSTNARGETPVRGGTVVPLTRPDSKNREPVKRRYAPSSGSRRRERRGTGT